MRTRRPELLSPAPKGLFDAGPVAGSAIVLPLVGRHDILGVLTLARRPGPLPLGADDMIVAEELARRAGFAIENARLFDRQRSVSETLQHSLLPERLPEIPGVAAAARYRAGGPGVDVGGDWYDLLALEGGRVLIAMGDVVGRGERAAALMGQLRTATRVYGLEGRSPGEIIGHVNDMLNELGPGDMATMTCAELDPEVGQLTIASAGHPPPLVIGVAGTASYLEIDNGPPVGAVARMSFEEHVRPFAPGETLVLFTDGLVEDRLSPIDIGLERLRLAVEGTDDQPVEMLCDRALGALDEHCHDDVALLAVRLCAFTDRISLQLATRPSTLKPLRAMLRRWLEDAGATEEETYEILVAAVEACANAIRHTRWADAGVYEFEASLGEEIKIVVRDRGTWRPPRNDGGGRGLQLIESFVDRLDIDKTPHGTTVTMTRRLANHARQELNA